MTKFWDMVDAETKHEAENFIERIKSKKIVKRVIPNMFVEVQNRISYILNILERERK